MNDFCARTNVYEKLRVALENLKTGGGLEAMFGDLEFGTVNLDVTDTGETIILVKRSQIFTSTPPLTPNETPIVESISTPDTEPTSDPVSDVVPKVKRKRN